MAIFRTFGSVFPIRLSNTAAQSKSCAVFSPNTARFAGVPLPFPPGTIVDAGLKYGKIGCMETARKITVAQELLAKAQRASGTEITQTVRTGLQLVAASRTYARLRKLRGKVHFSRTWAELKADR